MNHSVFKPRKTIWERCKEDPLVPIGNLFVSYIVCSIGLFLGCLVTGGILAFGLLTMTRNKQHLSQQVMRARVVAQGITIALVGLGSLGYTVFQPTKTPAQRKDD
jgi:hypothetical protein